MQGKDYEIIQRVLGGEKRAFAELVDRHKEKAMTLAHKMLKNREDSEEALQDAFVRAYNALPRFEWKSSFSTWFYRIVYNVCATALTKREEGFYDSIDEADEDRKLDLESHAELPDAEYESGEFESIVSEEIEKLPSVYASTFTLFFLQEMSYKEIVDVTGLPLGTVKGRLFRARIMIKEAVGKRFGLKTAFPDEEIKKENVA